jgi:PTH1 family peptidyl-tRNA hydrolase
VGFEVLAELGRRHGVGRPRTKFRAELLEAMVAGEKVLLLSPLTYMNRSGGSVQPARDFFRLPNDDLLIVCDDYNLPLARLRFRAKGSSGGQRGLEDILRRLGTDQVPRLRLGIGRPPEGWDPADYVLGRFRAQERSQIDAAVMRAADAVESWVADGVEKCMNQYNARQE